METFTECDKFNGRLRAICRGESGLDLLKTNKYRSRWGLAPLESVSVIEVAAKSVPKSAGGCGSCGGTKAKNPSGKLNGWGVGSQLAAEYRSRKYPHCADCHALSVKMDVNGIDWCKEHLEELVEDVLPRAKALVASAMALTHWGLSVVSAEDFVLRWKIRADIEEAIKRASVAPRPKHAPPTIRHRARNPKPKITQLPSRPAAKPVKNLALITCHFNPLNWRRPRENYHRFLEGLGPLADKLTTWELSFEGRFEIEGAHRVPGGPKHIMWQKEAMLNSAIWQLPKNVDAVAWLDADFLWKDDSWFERTIESLNKGLLAVQIFSNLTSLNARGGVERVTQSYSKAKGRGSFNCGGAWAARVETLQAIGGLYPFCLSGAGDSVALEAFIGRTDNPIRSWTIPEGATPSYRKSIKDWQHQAFEVVQGAVGHIDIEATHLFHGKRSLRAYPAFSAALATHGYDPNKDVRRTPAGILEWSSNKPRLHAAVKDYLLARREDG